MERSFQYQLQKPPQDEEVRSQREFASIEHVSTYGRGAIRSTPYSRTTGNEESQWPSKSSDGRVSSYSVGSEAGLERNSPCPRKSQATEIVKSHVAMTSSQRLAVIPVNGSIGATLPSTVTPTKA
jgi:hypothetical protein